MYINLYMHDSIIVSWEIPGNQWVVHCKNLKSLVILTTVLVISVPSACMQDSVYCYSNTLHFTMSNGSMTSSSVFPLE